MVGFVPGRGTLHGRELVVPNLDRARLAGLRHVSLWTPRTPALSASLIGFDIAGMTAEHAQARMLGKGDCSKFQPLCAGSHSAVSRAHEQ